MYINKTCVEMYVLMYLDLYKPKANVRASPSNTQHIQCACFNAHWPNYTETCYAYFFMSSFLQEVNRNALGFSIRPLAAARLWATTNACTGSR